jgi:hypothetical protein
MTYDNYKHVRLSYKCIAYNKLNLECLIFCPGPHSEIRGPGHFPGHIQKLIKKKMFPDKQQ